MIKRLPGFIGVVSALLYLADARADVRTLSADFLLGKTAPAGPVAMDEFRRDDAFLPPEQGFSGHLRFDPDDALAGFVVHHDPFGLAGDSASTARRLPPFDFELVQHQSDVIPLRRGVQRTAHPNWEIALQPGRAWREPDDDGWARVSLPFALQERSANCTHNGVLTWLFKGADVSRVYYQVSSETCAYFKFDTWGVLDATYEPADLADEAAAAVERLQRHRAARLPVKPMAELAHRYPQLGETEFGTADGIPAEDITVLGIVVDGIHYRSDCNTRHGPYPYCSSLPLPSYSTAKSIFAGIAAMRLEKLYPGVTKKTIASLVEACDSRRWRDVTIEHALDMATGNYRSAAFNADEDAPPSIDFLDSDSHEQKISYACRWFRRKAEPGSRFVYHTSDTYLVGAALDAFVSKSETDADLYESVLVEPLWRPLQLSPLLDVTKRTCDEAAMPFTGYGLTYESDDIVRLALWLARDGAKIDGEEMLDKALLNAAVQRTPGDRGLEAGSPDLRYNNGFWAVDAAPIIGCSKPIWIPFMSGYGGITVAMFPNGTVYYYFSDAYVFKWASAIVVANSISTLCVTETDDGAIQLVASVETARIALSRRRR